MNREEILDKHLGNIFLSKSTRKAVLEAMKEVESEILEIVKEVQTNSIGLLKIMLRKHLDE